VIAELRTRWEDLGQASIRCQAVGRHDTTYCQLHNLRMVNPGLRLIFPLRSFEVSLNLIAETCPDPGVRPRLGMGISSF
jgi:hypothetical protein